MARRFLVKIRLGVLRSNLSRADGYDYTQAEVIQWLKDAGFSPAGESWNVSESDLGHLDPSEVVEVTPSPPPGQP